MAAGSTNAMRLVIIRATAGAPGDQSTAATTASNAKKDGVEIIGVAVGNEDSTSRHANSARLIVPPDGLCRMGNQSCVVPNPTPALPILQPWRHSTPF